VGKKEMIKAEKKELRPSLLFSGALLATLSSSRMILRRIWPREWKKDRYYHRLIS
jgi:hypothetical protein